MMDGSRSRIVPVTLLLTILLSGYTNTVNSFVPSTPCNNRWGSSATNTALFSSTVAATPSASDIISRFETQMEKMRAKDKTSTLLSKDDLKVVHEDEHIVVVDKPAGVLCVSHGKEENPSLTQAVFEAFGCESGNKDKMVVHRLGMDTSGLIVFARTQAALRDLNTQFRTRKVTRKYEALLCGHVEQDDGEINMPLMRDYLNPPYMRISSDDHQRALIGLENELPEAVAKKILELPKNSITKYEVVSREELDGNAVSRVTLTSVSGRTHQLNVHTAAFGHPIAGDKVYGINGDAASNGGLEDVNGASAELQEAVNAAAKSMCVHAKYLSFKHPITREELSFESSSPF